MDDTLRHDICEEVAAISAQIIETAARTNAKETQRLASIEVLSNCELFLECRYDISLPLSDLYSLLHRQTEVIGTIVEKENPGRRMITLLTTLIKGSLDQEMAIIKLKEERANAEEAANEISLDLHNQYEEIVKLKRRYDTAEEQLSQVQGTVRGLRRELRLRQKQVSAKDTTIRELKNRLAQVQKQPSEHQCPNENNAIPKEATILRTCSREDREKRFAEIRLLLNRSTDQETPTAPRGNSTTNWRLQALRDARDSRLEAMRELLQKGSKTAVSTDQSNTKKARDSSASANTEETGTVTDLSSLGSQGW